ncbi:hypothetical protein LK495_15610, partial [Eggerthella lenta]|uniref:hypothetical protein n=1 Tax=Eggerthella lenta TaxID=84112 RepID=UPI001D0FC188
REVLEAEAAREGCDPLAREAIELRLASAKSSVKKYAVAEEAAGSDGRLRGRFCSCMSRPAQRPVAAP